MSAAGVADTAAVPPLPYMARWGPSGPAIVACFKRMLHFFAKEYPRGRGDLERGSGSLQRFQWRTTRCIGALLLLSAVILLLLHPPTLQIPSEFFRPSDRVPNAFAVDTQTRALLWSLLSVNYTDLCGLAAPNVRV